MVRQYVVSGCGGHARQSHVRFLSRHGYRLAGVFDPSSESREKLREIVQNDFVECTSYEQLLALPNTELVLIASPDAAHPGQLLKAIKRGKHVICEKPLATTFTGIAKVKLAFWLAERDGLVIESCHPRRVRKDPYGWVKNELELLVERFGALEHVGLDFSYHRPARKWKMARSLLLDHFCHEIDYLRWLVGDVPFKAHKLKDSHDDYAVAGIARGEDGDISFLFTGTRKLEGKVYSETILLRFARGEVMVDVGTGDVDYVDHEDRFIDGEDAPSLDYDHRFKKLASRFDWTLRTGITKGRERDLWVNNFSALMLARVGRYRYKPKK